MKKHLFFGAMAFTLMFAFCACETEDVVNDILDELTGEATFTVYEPTGASRALEFTSAITDTYEMNEETHDSATVAICAKVDLTDSDNKLDFPYLAFQFGDKTTGVKHCTQILTGELLRDFDYETVKELIQRPDGANLLVFGEKLPNQNDTAWYVSHEGYINVTNSYPAVGEKLTGSVSNMTVLYFTTRGIEQHRAEIEEAIDNGTFDILDYTEARTISGTFECRRMHVVQDIIAALKADGVVEK